MENLGRHKGMNVEEELKKQMNVKLTKEDMALIGGMDDDPELKDIEKDFNKFSKILRIIQITILAQKKEKWMKMIHDCLQNFRKW